MEGIAIHWFTMVHQLHYDLTWNHFKQELLNRLGGIANCSPYEQLVVLRHQDNVDEFELIASIIPRESEAIYLGYFMYGLKEEIKNWVRLLFHEFSIHTAAHSFFIFPTLME